MEVQGYDLNLQYKPGKEMLIADGLSRLPNAAKNQQVNMDVKIQHVEFLPQKLINLKEESRRDPTTAALRETIISGWPDDRKTTIYTTAVLVLQRRDGN